jgi:hypothetical protein
MNKTPDSSVSDHLPAPDFAFVVALLPGFLPAVLGLDVGEGARG